MIDPKCKICRRAGEKLFLKGERCFSPKCAMVRKNYPPGVHGKRMGRRVSEYALQLFEKQKIKNLYNLREKQLYKYFKTAQKIEGSTVDILFRLLETRLDNVIFKAGLTTSRSIARQLVSHGYFTVNGKKVTIPSYNLKIGDVIKIKPGKLTSAPFKDLELRLKKYEPPKWLKLDKKVFEIKIIALPEFEDAGYAGSPKLIIEYYSR